MDLGAAARAGIAFFTFKATEGTGVRHFHLADSLNRARAAGIEVLGAYHVLRSTSVSGQIDHLLGYVDSAVPWWRDFPGWFWQCDAEDWGYDFPGPDFVRAFADQLASRTGKTVICYAPRGMYGDTLAGLTHKLWNANYGANPPGDFRALYPGDDGIGWRPYSGQIPVFWQYSDRANIAGQPSCDASAFRGSVEDLRRLVGANSSSASNGDDDMPQGEIGPGFAFDAQDNWIDQNRAVPVPLPTVGNAPGQWGGAWLYLAATTDLTIRFGAHGNGVWTWQDVSLNLAGGTRGPLALPAGTDTVLIGRKKRSPDDNIDSGPVRWQVQYAPR
jgi:hypothetical protein